MTRDEVIKALECCIVSEIEWHCPEECPRFSKFSGEPCEAALMREALALLKEKHRCSDCAHQSRGLCARTGCPTRPDVWCDEWEARGK